MPTIREFEQWLTTGEAARRLGLSRQGVVWLIEARKLRAANTALGRLVDPRDVARVRRERSQSSS
jgi:excisionase family DNA binding protein